MNERISRGVSRATEFCFICGYVSLVNTHCKQPGLLTPYLLLFTAIALII
jgi:hypothetical protein